MCMLLVSSTLACGIHEHSVSHCCDFCHFGFLPWVQAASQPSILPPFAREWRPSSAERDRTAEITTITSFSRGPPFC
jgi:hypothetical protein